MRKVVLYTVFLLSSLFVMTGCRTQKAVIGQREEHEHKKREKVEKKLSASRKAILEEAETWLGTPYMYAHQEKGQATDCSGFVMMTYMDAIGYALPRNSAKQAEFCNPLKADDIKPGDLVFFATGKDPHKVSHVGIVMDSNNFIHASSSKGVVVSKLNNPWYVKRFLMYGRPPKLE